MTDRYHYDSKGNYTGKSSDTPPSSGIGGAIVLIVILVVLFKSCSGSDSNPKPATTNQSNVQAPPTQTYSPSNESQPEQKQKWIIKD